MYVNKHTCVNNNKKKSKKLRTTKNNLYTILKKGKFPFLAKIRGRDMDMNFLVTVSVHA